MRDKNRQLYESIEQLAEKYVQYSELLTPLLETNLATKNLLGNWSINIIVLQNYVKKSFSLLSFLIEVFSP